MRRTLDITSKACFEYLRAGFLPRFCVELGRRWFFGPLVRFFRGFVLDVGCGVGHFLSVYPNALGIDVNPYCVRYCRDQGFNAVEGNAYHLPFLEGSFDGVLLSHVLEHLDHPAQALTEALRVLKADGTLCVRVPTATGYRIDPTHKTYLTYRSLVEMLQCHKCLVVKHYYHPIPWKLLGEAIIYNELRIIARKWNGSVRVGTQFCVGCDMKDRFVSRKNPPGAEGR